VEVAKDLWNDIKERFSITNGPRIQQLKSDLAECRQKGLTIADYYGKLKQLWDELDNYEQPPTCKCGKCECELGATLEKKREEDKVHSFLMRLDEPMYGTVRSNILAQDPLPSLNKVYSILIQEERVKIITQRKEERGDVMALAIRAGRDGSNKSLVCTHCKRTGHAAESCFALVGYPEWWGDRPRSDGKGGGRDSSRGQRGRGQGGRGPARAHAVQGGIASASGSTPDASRETAPVPSLTSEQWQTLVKMLSGSQIETGEKMTGKPVTWIIDTGASNHMTGRIGDLCDLHDIAPCPVGLPNGSSIMATKVGSFFSMEICALKMFFMCRD